MKKYFLILIQVLELPFLSLAFMKSSFPVDQQVGYHNMVKRFNNETVSLVKNSTVGHDLFYTSCGETRRCFGYPNGCTATRSCDVAVSIASDNVGNRYSFHMFALRAPGYVAVGLSEDGIMVMID